MEGSTPSPATSQLATGEIHKIAHPSSQGGSQVEHPKSGATARGRVAQLLKTAGRPTSPILPLPSVRSLLGWRTGVDYLVLLGLVTFGIVIDMDLSRFKVPFYYSGDALGYGASAKTLIETGWIQENHRLGAPFGQLMYDMPLGGDNFNFLVMKALAVFTHDWGLLLNAFFLATFVLAATTAWACARLLGAGRFTAIGVALLFDFSGFHFARYYHLMLADIAIVPVGIYLAVRAANGTMFDLRLRTKQAWLTNVGTAVLCLVIGGFGAYWAVFTAITIGLMGSAAALVRGNARPFFQAVLGAAAVVASLAINEFQTLWYTFQHGANPVVARRFSIELDSYALHPIQLVTPPPGSWTNLGPLRQISAILTRGNAGESTQYLGTLTGAIFLLMLVMVLARSTRARSSETAEGTRLLGATAIVWVLIASVGGLSWLIWLTGFHSIRSWGRASVFIMFLTLMWGALVVASMQPRIALLGRRARIGVAVLAVLLLVDGVVDEFPEEYPADRAGIASQFDLDKAYFTSVEGALPTGSNVFNLPIRRYPEEAPTVNSRDYDLLLPYLHTKTLRFSYGGMKGREAEWQQALMGLSGKPLVDSVVATGFGAIMIDRAGYEDKAAALEASITALTHVTPIVSADGRWSTFPLQTWIASHAPSQDLRSRLLSRPIVTPGSCFDFGGSTATEEVLQCPTSGSLTVETPVPTTDRTIQIQVSSPAGPGTFDVYVDGKWLHLNIDTAPKTFTLRAGSKTFTTFAYRSDAPPTMMSLDVDVRVTLRVQVTPAVSASD